MAFSYSDNNFTVIGNLCFVHIVLDGTQRTYDIPPAISDRMLFDQFACSYVYIAENKTRFSTVVPTIGFASITHSKIFCSDVGHGYLSFFFPIDSNK